MAAVYYLGAIFGTGLQSTIIALMIACCLPFLWALIAKWLGGFRPNDNQNPREFLAKLQGRAARAHAVQVNSFESLPIFLAAVLMAIYCFVPQLVINGYAWAYVFLRVVYGVAYLYNWSVLRSIIWALSLGCALMLFLLSLKMLGGI